MQFSAVQNRSARALNCSKFGSVRACVTSLGAETGVAKLVGKAMRTYDPASSIPCIGIMPWCCIDGNVRPESGYTVAVEKQPPNLNLCANL